MKKVFVNGYGSIGSRIAKFIKEDSDIDVIGIGKHSPDENVQHAINDGFSVYVPKSKSEDFKNFLETPELRLLRVIDSWEGIAEIEISTDSLQEVLLSAQEYQSLTA